MSEASLQNKSSFESTELKLSALLLSEIPGSTFETFLNDNPSSKKTIKIIYLSKYEKEVRQLIREFLERRARGSIYSYNLALNLLRDAVKGQRKRIDNKLSLHMQRT